MGGGSEADEGVMSKLFSACKRMITDESIFTMHFSNFGSFKRRIAFSAPSPGEIIAIDMAQLGEQIICRKDAFLCAALGTKLDINLNRKLGAGLSTGEGFSAASRRRLTGLFAGWRHHHQISVGTRNSARGDGLFGRSHALRGLRHRARR